MGQISMEIVPPNGSLLSGNQQVHALAGFVLALEAGKTRLRPNDIVILDEAGMSPTVDLARLAQATVEAGAKLVLSGDTKQLQPVGAGAPLKILERVLGSSAMLQIRRQSLGWQRDASMLFAKGMASTALAEYEKRGHIEWLQGTDEAIKSAADRFLADRLWDEAAGESPVPTSLAIAAWNNDVLELNREIRARLQAAGLMSDIDVEIPVAFRDKETDKLVERTLLLAKGDRIAFTETVRRPKREIRNADAATVVEVDASGVTIRFDDGQTISATYSQLVGRRGGDQPMHPSMKHIFAVTSHFAQGLTVDRAYVLGTRSMSRESVYVAMTRHRHSVQLFVDASRIEPAPVGKNPLSHLVSPNQQKVLDAEADLAGRKLAYFAECDRPAEKLNASDFAADPLTWAVDGPAFSQGSLRERIRSRERLRLRESALREEAPAAAGIPNSKYKQLRDEFGKASSSVASSILQWVVWLRRQLQQMVSPKPHHIAGQMPANAPTRPRQSDEGPEP